MTSNRPRAVRVNRPYPILEEDSVHIPLVTLIGFQSLDVFVRLFLACAALLLNDLAQRGIDIFGHPAGVAANEELRSFVIDPFSNLGRAFEHLVSHIL